MSEQIATTSQTGSIAADPHSTATLHPAEIDYVVQVSPVANPLGLKALQHQRIYQVWKVLVDHERHVVQVLQLMSSSVMDERYIVN
jgi:hypothetical protein